MNDVIDAFSRPLYFFGGYGATQADVEAWKVSAFTQNNELDIVEHPYPLGANSYDPVPHFQFGSIVPVLFRFVKPVILVGHSSGCAVANEVASQLFKAGRKDFRLICLDGFRANEILHPEVWSAKHGEQLSLNYNVLKDSSNFHVYEPKKTKGIWSLHYSLVNKNSFDISSISEGYHNCEANLCWL